MIAAVGTDLCDVGRLELAVTRTGRRFLERVFTAGEREHARRAPHPARELARAFALKEATFKAIGRGWPHDIGFDEVSLGPAAGGPREVRLTGRAADWAARAGLERLVGATCSDAHVAFAIVVAERRHAAAGGAGSPA